MLSWYPQSQYIPCPDCGAPVASEEEADHQCEQQRFVEYQLLLMRPQIAAFELRFHDWLCTPHGRFALYYAARQRLAWAAA